MVTLPQELKSLLHVIKLMSEGGYDCIVEVGYLSLFLWAVLLHLEQ